MYEYPDQVFILLSVGGNPYAADKEDAGSVEYVRKDDQPVDFSTMPKDTIIDYLQTSVRYWQDAYQKEKNRVIELEANEKGRLELLNLLKSTNDEMVKKEWKE